MLVPRLSFTLAVAGLLLAPRPVRAQRADPVRAGDVVRVYRAGVRPAPLTATVVRLTPDTLYVLAARGGEASAVPRARIARLDLLLDERPRGELVRRTALIGGAAGAALGAAVGLAGPCPEAVADADQPRCETRPARVAGGLVIGAAAGALVGGLVGLGRPATRWERDVLPARAAWSVTR